MESTLPQVAATALTNISFAWTVGILTSRFWLMNQTAAWQKTVAPQLSLAMSIGLIACTVSLLLSLWTESAVMGDVAWVEAWPAFVQMLKNTHYGHAGAAAIVLLVIALLAHFISPPNVGVGT